MKNTTAFLITLMTILGCFYSGCIQSENDYYNDDNNDYCPKPNIIVTSKASRTGYEGIDYCFFVDIVLKNIGDSGASEVWAEVNQDNNHFEKHETVYLKKDESRSLTFKFCEYSFWSGSSAVYRVWVEN